MVGYNPFTNHLPTSWDILVGFSGYVSRPSLGVELAPDAMSESLGMPGAMVMKAPWNVDGFFQGFFPEDWRCMAHMYNGEIV